MVHFFQLLSSAGLFLVLSKLLLKEKFKLILDLSITVGLTLIITSISYFFNVNESSLGIVYLVGLFAYFYTINKKFVINILSLSASMIIAILADMLSITLISMVVGISSVETDKLRSEPVAYFASFLFMVAIALALAYLIRILFSKSRDMLQLFQRNELPTLLGFIAVAAFLFLYWLTFTVVSYTTISRAILLIIMMVIVGAILVASLFFVKSKTSVIELKSKENELTQLRMYTNEIESMQQEIRKFKHDYMNILASLSGYIEQDNMAGLKKYFDEKIMTFSVQKDSIDKTVDRLIYVEQEELKGLLAMKAIRAQELGVKVEIDMVEKVKFHMDIVDLCRVVGIFVDNAIEAAALSTEKTIAIGMVNVEEKALLIVTNTVAEMVPIYKLREKGFTTKGNSHGLGLEIVRGILKSYPNVNNDMKFENQMFTQVLEIRAEH